MPKYKGYGREVIVWVFFFFFFKYIIRKKGFEKKNVTKILRDMMKFIFKKKKNHP